MAFPTVITTKAGRKIFKDAAGKFISEKTYNLLNRRDPATGKFISAAKAKARGSIAAMESRLRSTLGAPPTGKSWSYLANKYEERFRQYMR